MKLKKTLAILLVLCFAFALLPFGGTAYAADDPAYTGTFGSGFTYDFDPETGVLTVSGTGVLAAFAAEKDAPWAGFRDDVKELVIKDGITAIEKGVFANCTNLKKVTFPATIKKIDSNAFSGCKRVQEVLSSGNAESILALSRIITMNDVAELELNKYAEAVNAAAVEYYVPQVQQAVANNKETKTEIIDTSGGKNLKTWTENGVTYTEGTITNPVYGELNVHREETTNEDGTKSAKETQTSPDGTYQQVIEERISPDGKSSFHQAETTQKQTDENGVEHVSKQTHATTTVYNDDGTGTRTELHDLAALS